MCFVRFPFWKTPKKDIKIESIIKLFKSHRGESSSLNSNLRGRFESFININIFIYLLQLDATQIEKADMDLKRER